MEDRGKVKVLSLFDGISCGQLALERAGIEVDEYYASEIDKHAIKVTQHHFPNTIQLGDVVDVKSIYLPRIDLLMGGSPCQGFSSAGKGLNFEDPRSKLFFEFVRLYEQIQPKYFLLENVVMPQEYQDIISSYLGVKPIKINSSLVSAQNRVRLYWTDIPVEPPEDRGIKLKDFIKGEYKNKATITGRRINERGVREDYNKQVKITQCLEVRNKNRDKSNCLTTVAKDNVLSNLPPGRYPNAFHHHDWFRYYTLAELCQLQTLPVDYFDGIVSETKAQKLIGNGWTVDMIVHILEGLK